MSSGGLFPGTCRMIDDVFHCQLKCSVDATMKHRFRSSARLRARTQLHWYVWMCDRFLLSHLLRFFVSPSPATSFFLSCCLSPSPSIPPLPLMSVLGCHSHDSRLNDYCRIAWRTLDTRGEDRSIIQLYCQTTKNIWQPPLTALSFYTIYAYMIGAHVFLTTLFRFHLCNMYGAMENFAGNTNEENSSVCSLIRMCQLPWAKAFRR